MLLFLQYILSIDYSEGYYVITTPGKPEYLMSHKDGTLRALAMDYPKSINDPNVVKIEKKNDGYSIKFMATNKYLCGKGVLPGAYSCPDSDKPMTKFKIEDKNGNKIIKTRKRCLYRAGLSGDKGQYLALVKCDLFKNKQSWEVSELKIPGGESMAAISSDSSASLNKTSSVSANKRSSVSANKTSSVSANKTVDTSMSANSSAAKSTGLTQTAINDESKILFPSENSILEIKPNKKPFKSDEASEIISDSLPIKLVTDQPLCAQPVCMQNPPACCNSEPLREQSEADDMNSKKEQESSESSEKEDKKGEMPKEEKKKNKLKKKGKLGNKLKKEKAKE